MVAKRIAVIALCGIILIERVVLDGIDIDNVRDRQTSTDASKRDCDEKRK